MIQPGHDRCPHCLAVLDAERLDLLDPAPPPHTSPRSEAAVQRALLERFGASPAVRLFRNSVGLARDARTGQHIRFGLARGSSDLIGIVAPHGRFIAPEVKSAKGQVTEEQQAFLTMVRRFGGVSGVVRCEDDLARLIEEAQR